MKATGMQRDRLIFRGVVRGRERNVVAGFPKTRIDSGRFTSV